MIRQAVARARRSFCVLRLSQQPPRPAGAALLHPAAAFPRRPFSDVSLSTAADARLGDRKAGESSASDLEGRRGAGDTRGERDDSARHEETRQVGAASRTDGAFPEDGAASAEEREMATARGPISRDELATLTSHVEGLVAAGRRPSAELVRVVLVRLAIFHTWLHDVQPEELRHRGPLYSWDRDQDAQKLLLALRRSGFGDVARESTEVHRQLGRGLQWTKKPVHRSSYSRMLDVVGYTPGVPFYNLLLEEIAMEGDLVRANKIVARLLKDGHRPDGWTYGALIAAALNAREYEACFVFEDQMRRARVTPDRAGLRWLIRACGITNKPDRVESLLAEHLALPGEPDALGVAYGMALNALARCGDFEAVRRVWASMRDGGQAPTAFVAVSLLNPIQQAPDCRHAPAARLLKRWLLGGKAREDDFGSIKHQPLSSEKVAEVDQFVAAL